MKKLIRILGLVMFVVVGAAISPARRSGVARGASGDLCWTMRRGSRSKCCGEGDAADVRQSRSGSGPVEEERRVGGRRRDWRRVGDRFFEGRLRDAQHHGPDQGGWTDPADGDPPEEEGGRDRPVDPNVAIKDQLTTAAGMMKAKQMPKRGRSTRSLRRLSAGEAVPTADRAHLLRRRQQGEGDRGIAEGACRGSRECRSEAAARQHADGGRRAGRSAPDPVGARRHQGHRSRRFSSTPESRWSTSGSTPRRSCGSTKRWRASRSTRTATTTAASQTCRWPRTPRRRRTSKRTFDRAEGCAGAGDREADTGDDQVNDFTNGRSHGRGEAAEGTEKFFSTGTRGHGGM